ncbi:MAG: cysteine peptidase family C39 domain-containing protein [Planctomycetes bacterium]|nr:cysteine peptidase family C39 domain-containing protein [Planctomycetota bacterium]
MTEPMRARLLPLVLLALAGPGCASPLGARGVPPAAALSPAAVMLPVSVEAQEGDADCGLACLTALLRFHGAALDDAARERFPAVEGAGIRAGDIRDYLDGRGFRAVLVRGTLDEAPPAGLLRVLRRGLPVLVAVTLPDRDTSHYVLVSGFDPERRLVVLMDPAWGAGAVPFDRFDALWARAERLMLVAAPTTQAARPGG